VTLVLLSGAFPLDEELLRSEVSQGLVPADGGAMGVTRRDNPAGAAGVFPRFETFRKNIEGNYWFPTYTRSDDTLHFRSGDVRIRMIVRYKNYKRFSVTIKIGAPTEIKPDKP